MLIEGGYTYTKVDDCDNKVIWRCTKWKSDQCKGRCHTTSDLKSGEI